MYRSDRPSTTAAVDRKNTLNSTAKLSTTYMPPNVVRFALISVSAAISAPMTPTNAIGMHTHLRSRGRNRSATSTTRMVPVRNSSGMIAWKSMFTSRSASAEQPGQRRDGIVGHAEHDGRPHGHGQQPGEQRPPADPLHRAEIADRRVSPPLGHDPVPDPLDGPQEVAGGEDRADAGEHHHGPEQPHRQPRPRMERGEHREHLAPEPRQRWQAERRDAREGEHPPQ